MVCPFVAASVLLVPLAVGCATGWPSAETRPDVDAEFEARFDSKELQLKPIDKASRQRVTTSTRPFLQEAPPVSGTAPSMESTGPTLAAVTLDTDEAGVEFHIFSIGQADSMLVIGPGQDPRTLLFDLGETGWNSRRNCLRIRDDVVALTGEAHVDYLVISHFHTDHAAYPRTVSSAGRIQEGGGIFCLLDGTRDFFSVGTLIDRGDGEAQFKPDRQRIHQAIIDSIATWTDPVTGTLGSRVPADFTPGLIDLGQDIQVEVVATGGRVFAGDPGALANAEAQSPGTYSATTQASPNDFSIGLEFTIGDFELFTAGDLTGAPGDPPYAATMRTPHNQIYTNVESHMVRRWTSVSRESDVEVYVVNHHGSRNSSTTDLADALEPEVVIYSAGGRHRHPSEDIADRFLNLGADQMLTSSADDDEWPGGVFPAQYGNGWDNPVGDILIFAPLQGAYYTVATEAQAFDYLILSDLDEAAD